MGLKEDIRETRQELINGNDVAGLYPSQQRVLDAAMKWAAIEWMWEEGFADAYKFSCIMENWQNYEDAYRREMQEGKE